MASPETEASPAAETIDIPWVVYEEPDWNVLSEIKPPRPGQAKEAKIEAMQAAVATLLRNNPSTPLCLAAGAVGLEETETTLFVRHQNTTQKLNTIARFQIVKTEQETYAKGEDGELYLIKDIIAFLHAQKESVYLLQGPTPLPEEAPSTTDISTHPSMPISKIPETDPRTQKLKKPRAQKSKQERIKPERKIRSRHFEKLLSVMRDFATLPDGVQEVFRYMLPPKTQPVFKYMFTFENGEAVASTTPKEHAAKALTVTQNDLNTHLSIAARKIKKWIKTKTTHPETNTTLYLGLVPKEIASLVMLPQKEQDAILQKLFPPHRTAIIARYNLDQRHGPIPYARRLEETMKELGINYRRLNWITNEAKRNIRKLLPLKKANTIS